MPAKFHAFRRIQENVGSQVNEACDERNPGREGVIEENETMQKADESGFAGDRIQLALHSLLVGRGFNRAFHPFFDQDGIDFRIRACAGVGSKVRHRGHLGYLLPSDERR